MADTSDKSHQLRLEAWPISVWNLPVSLPTKSDIRKLAQQLEPQALVRIGLIGNRGSRQNLRSRLSLLGHILPEADLFWQTRNPQNLVDALQSLLFNAHVNVLAVAGGDGTLHHVVNLLVRISDEIQARDGVRPHLPPLLVMPGGTMNIFARAFGSKDLPLRAVARFREVFAGNPIAKLSTHNVGLLHIQSQKRGKLVGFVLGSGLVVDALRVYENLGSGYAGLGRFLFHATTGPIFGSKVWNENLYRLARGYTEVGINEGPPERARAVVCSTIPLTLARGMMQGMGSLGGQLASNKFMTIVAKDMSDKDFIKTLPNILRKSHHPQLHRQDDMTQISFRGPLTVDGEIFANEDHFEYFADDEVTVRRLGFDLNIVRPDWATLII